MERSPASWSLGEFLRNEREKRGVTVEQMVSATKISVRLLHALENDQYADLPAKPFIRGFVVSYCRFLGISSQEVLTRFSRYLDEKAEDRPKKDSGHSGYAFDRKEGDGARTGLWILMGTMLAVGIVVIAVFKPSFKHHRKSSVEKLQEANLAAPVAEGDSVPRLQTVALEVSATSSPTPSASPSASVQATAAVAATATPSLAPDREPVPTSRPNVASSTDSVRAEAQPLETPSPSPSPAVATAPSPLPSRRPDPMLSGKDLLKDEIRIKVVVKALEDVWVKFKIDQKDKNRLVLRKGGVLVLFAKDFAALQTSSPLGVTISRASGAPNQLRLLHGDRPMVEILQQKKGVAADGRTIFAVADASAPVTNPFEGETPMAPPPPKPERTASPAASESPNLSTP